MKSIRVPGEQWRESEPSISDHIEMCHMFDRSLLEKQVLECLQENELPCASANQVKFALGAFDTRVCRVCKGHIALGIALEFPESAGPPAFRSILGSLALSHLRCCCNVMRGRVETLEVRKVCRWGRWRRSGVGGVASFAI